MAQCLKVSIKKGKEWCLSYVFAEVDCAEGRNYRLFRNRQLFQKFQHDNFGTALSSVHIWSVALFGWVLIHDAAFSMSHNKTSSALA